MLKSRFVDLWLRQASGASTESASALYDCLEQKYGEPWRRYHTLKHVDDCLASFDACRHLAKDPDAIELAIWFHDSIYEIGDPENEANSRDWFLEVSAELIEDSTRTFVAELIMDTRHKIPPGSADGNLMVDIDLNSFSLPWDQYIQDSRAVRAEFTDPYSNETRLKMINFLGALIRDRNLYYTDFYLEKHESQARENIRRYIDDLSQE